jgi:N-acetylglucosamine-6-sulfatase
VARSFVHPLARAARCLFSVAWGLAGVAAAAAARQPNVVMIMTDDLDTSVFQTALALGYLPNIDAELVKKGTTFTNTFAALPMCCPSRTSYLTGQYPHNHHVYRNRGRMGGFDHFDNDGSTVAVWMHAAGYRTGLVGKYLNGYGRTAKSGGGAYIPPGWDTWGGLFSAAQFNYYMSQNGVRVQYGSGSADYQTDVVAALGGNFVQKKTDGRPFYLTMTPTAPHYEGPDDEDDDSGGVVRPAPRYADTPPLATIPPESLASYNEADMSDKPAWMQADAPVDPVAQRAGYNSKIAAMRAVDDLVGTLFAALRATGHGNDTAVIFTSDNGFQYGSHRRTQKTESYEESIRIPMIIRGPGQTVPRSVDAWAMNIDWAPTILDYGGATPDIEVDGTSLVRFIDTAEPPEGRRTVLIEHPCDGTTMADHPPYDAIRTKDPAFTQDASGKTVLVYAETFNKHGAIVAREFYDLATDPLEDESRHASTDPLVQRQMKALANRLDQLKVCAGDGCRQLQR